MLVSELYVYQNAWCNHKNSKYSYLITSVTFSINISLLLLTSNFLYSLRN